MYYLLIEVTRHEFIQLMLWWTVSKIKGTKRESIDILTINTEHMANSTDY